MLSEHERAEVEAELEGGHPGRREVCRLNGAGLQHAPRSAAMAALKILQRHRGWVSDDAIRDLAPLLGMTSDELEGVATFYSLIFRRPVGERVLKVCDSVVCWALGGESLLGRLEQRLGIKAGETTADGRFTLLRICCLGDCDHAPVMMVDDTLVRDLTPEKLDGILADDPFDKLCRARVPPRAAVDGGPWKARPTSPRPEPILTRNMRSGGPPLGLAEYEAAGGYAALRKALTRHTPAEIVKLVSDSNLRGRGGAGFPTGTKWAELPPVDKSAHPRIFIVNCDEMEPGAFKDRLLVEGDPHQLIEGAIISAYACQTELTYVFIRHEYLDPPARILERALAEARQAGYLGRNILGSGFDCEPRLHISAGRYMCGEETGLINAMEGRAAHPRTKPPYAVQVGLWGLPTVVNNVETVCCVPHIVERGAEWFKRLGKAKDAGMKIYGVSGRVKRPGSFELALGTTLRELIEEHAGGMQDGVKFRGALPGGASTMFLDEAEMDLPLEYESLGERRLLFGTGSVIVLDDRTCPVGMVRNLQQFFARESCGWCTPCRDGLPWVENLLADLEEGRGRPGDVELLLEQSHYIRGNTFCALALGAVAPLDSSLRKFREDYEAHLHRGRCPWESGD